ncbi:MAG: alpha/beta hydrolase [Dehalococcoidia bacterium]
MTAGTAELEHRYIEGSPRLHYTLSGAPEERTVVMLHGSTQHSPVWDGVVPLLSGFRVAALDLRGHGRSERNGAYQPDDYVSDVERLVEALDAPSTAIVGHSMGSLVAMRYAGQRPGSVWAAAFVDIDARPPDSQVETLNTAGARPGRAFDSAEARARIERLRPGASDELIERMMSASFIEQDGRFLECYDRATLAQFAHWDNRELLKAIDVPALVMRGSDSTVSGAQATEEMVAALPDGRFHELSGASHMLHVERPDEVGAVLAGFLRGAADGAGSGSAGAGA